MSVLAALLLSVADVPPAKATWIFPEDYPAELLRTRASGTVEFALTFNPEGRVTQCLITKSAGKAMLDSTACRLARNRARALAGSPREQSFSHDWKAPR
nr:TonB family protein [uncultured Sphingomonas sp.]